MIDTHTHCQLSKHWGPEWEKNWRPVYGEAYGDYSPADFDAAMRAGGVDLALTFGLRATRAGVATPNEYVEWFCANTETETVGFMALDLADEGVMTQLQDGVGRGLRGIKLYPVLAHFDPRDAVHDPFYRAAERAGLIILWHMGATPSPEGRLEVSNPLVVDEIARRYPGLRQIIAHLGHPWHRETIITLRKNRRVYADVSGCWARPTDGYLALIRAQEWGVVDKLLFGSDFPLWTPSIGRSSLQRIADTRIPGLPAIQQETLDWLMDGDPREYLGLK